MCAEEGREEAGRESVTEGVARKDVPEVVEIPWLRVSSMVSGGEDRAIVTIVLIGEGRAGKEGQRDPRCCERRKGTQVGRVQVVANTVGDQISCTPSEKGGVRRGERKGDRVRQSRGPLAAAGTLEQDAQECAEGDGGR